MRREAGFSLIELMVATTVTLILGVAIYGLLASGNNAFRREPEVASRQQNIRLAMDLISRDVLNAGAALPAFSQVLYGGQVLRYRIAPSTDPQDPGPVLWRSASGVYDRDGVAQPESGAPGFPAATSPWHLLARRIEDLQVEYLAGDWVWRNRPPVAVVNDWSTLVRQVRITLSARVTAANLQGETRAGGTGPNALRGQLTTVITPRAAFHELQMGSQIR